MELWMLTSIPFQTPVNCLLYLLVARYCTKLELSHPLPNLSELFATLAGGKTFTKLNLLHTLPNSSELYLVVERN